MTVGCRSECKQVISAQIDTSKRKMQLIRNGTRNSITDSQVSQTIIVIVEQIEVGCFTST